MKINPVADPDLQKRRWEGGCSHPGPEMGGGGGGQSQNKFFFASVSSKIKGGPFLWIRHCNQSGDFVCGSSRGLIIRVPL